MDEALTYEQLVAKLGKLESHLAELELALAEKTRVDESRSQYEFIVNTSRELLSLVDRDYRYAAVNDTYCRAHNRSRKEIIGVSVADVWGCDVFESTIRKNLDGCFAGKEMQYEAEFSLPALGMRKMGVTYYPYRSSDGQVSHVVVVSRDITEKKAVEHELVALKKAVETMQLGVTISNCSGRIIYSNPAEAAMHGYTPKELIGRHVSLFAPNIVLATTPLDFSKVSSWRRESANVDRNGRVFPVHLMSDVVRNQDNEAIAIVTTCEDITERKLTLEKLADMLSDLEHSRDELMHAYDTTIEGWSRALDFRDKETEGHSQRVTDLTVRVAKYMGIDSPNLLHIRRGALLHDIGKLGVPDHILFKPDMLSAEEWLAMKQHPEIAFALLAPIEFLRPAINIPYCHHENWDGSGYPRGLSKSDIPLEARIFSVVDVWDALSNDRYYRKAWPAEKVRLHINGLAGTHFDPQAVDAFMQVIKESWGGF